MNAPLNERAAVRYVPAAPVSPTRVLVLAPGHPWPDGSRTDAQLREYARAAVRRWQRFADEHGAILLAPVFGSAHADFREGGAADFVTALVDEVARQSLPDGDGRFAIHGHSAGAQFAMRYLVARPSRLTAAVVSAPSEYAFPDPNVAWPRGMAGAPAGADWLAAASEVAVTVVAGMNDTEPRPAAPGHATATRVDRARAWVDAMRWLAAGAGRPPSVEFAGVEGADHDELAMAAPAQQALANLLR